MRKSIYHILISCIFTYCLLGQPPSSKIQFYEYHITEHFVPDKNLSVTANVPTQILDLSTVDTSFTNKRFTRHGFIRVSGIAGYPLVIDDLNNNGKMDFVGSYKINNNSSLVEVAIFEQEAETVFQLKKIYEDSLIYPLSVTDVDNDGLNELNLRRSPRYFDNYEAVSIDSYPSEFQFSHNMWTGGGGAVGSEIFTDLDQDGFVDVIYHGDDTLCGESLTFVAEYSPVTHDFQRVFNHCLSAGFTFDYSIADFDDDGALEFASGTNAGEVYVVENTSNDNYSVIFSDTLPAVNANMSAVTSDLDQNGKVEFFIVGDEFYNGDLGLRFYWYEANGNNSLSAIRSLFLPNISGFGISSLTSFDINGDGFEELVLALEGLCLILTFNTSDEFEVFYLNWWTQGGQQIQSVNVYDINTDLKPDLLISIRDTQNSPRYRSYIFQQETISAIGSTNETDISGNFELYQNYPNPFNPTTRIDFRVLKPGLYTMEVLDINGKQIKIISKNYLVAGFYSTKWDGTDNFGLKVGSGIYFYRLFTTDDIQVKQMILVQ